MNYLLQYRVIIYRIIIHWSSKVIRKFLFASVQTSLETTHYTRPHRHPHGDKSHVALNHMKWNHRPHPTCRLWPSSPDVACMINFQPSRGMWGSYLYVLYSDYPWKPLLLPHETELRCISNRSWAKFGSHWHDQLIHSKGRQSQLTGITLQVLTLELCWELGRVVHPTCTPIISQTTSWPSS